MTEKTEDSDTDVDESMAQTKPQDEPKSAGVTGDKENGETKMKDSEVDNSKDEVTENEVEKAADKEKTEDAIDVDAEEKKDVVVIEDEEEEPEPEEEIVEDRDDGGEDPSEVEVEKFNMPGEQAIMSGKWLLRYSSCYFRELSVRSYLLHC